MSDDWIPAAGMLTVQLYTTLPAVLSTTSKTLALVKLSRASAVMVTLSPLLVNNDPLPAIKRRHSKTTLTLMGSEAVQVILCTLEGEMSRTEGSESSREITGNGSVYANESNNTNTIQCKCSRIL